MLMVHETQKAQLHKKQTKPQKQKQNKKTTFKELALPRADQKYIPQNKLILFSV